MVLFTVATSAGTNPASTSFTVSANLSSIGGSAIQSFFDDGSNGDQTAGDGTFSYATAVTAMAKTYSILFTVTDDKFRSSGGTIALTINPPPPPAGVTALASSTTSIVVNWLASGATSYEIVRRGAGTMFEPVGMSMTPGFNDSPVTAGAAYLYAVRAVDAYGNRSQDSAPDLATAVIFPEPIFANVTKVRAAHVNELRPAINAVRALAGMGAFVFADVSL